MSSPPPPPDKPDKHGLRRTVRDEVHRVRDSFQSLLSPGSPTGDPRRSPSPGIGSRLFSFSRSTTPAPKAILPAPESGQQMPSSSASETPADPGASPTAVPDNKRPPNPALAGLVSSLRLLETGAELFPPFKSAVGGVIACLDVVQRAENNRTDYKALEKEFTSMSNTLNQHISALDLEKNNGSMAHISRSLQTHVSEIKDQVERKGIGRLLDATQDQEDVIRRYREIEMLFRQFQCDISLRTHDRVKQQLEETHLKGVSPIDDAKYDSAYSMTIKRRPCTAQTREAIHQALRDWTTSPTSEKIYWMNGMAGTGKTTIAYSFCEWLKSTNRLGASFFCSRISSTCRSLSRIIPTIAYQLARYSPAFRSSLCAILEADPDAGTLNVAQQFEKLINQPMLQVKGAIPSGVVVVIDALDECDDNYSVRLLLDVLLRFAGHLPVKFFVASRPEHVIWAKMTSQGGTARSIVHLHDIEASIVEEDIKKYLTDALSSMSPPASTKQIEMLAKRSRNLFIYAATVVRYIYPEDIAVDSATRLDSMIKFMTSSGVMAENKYKDLDLLYTTVLKSVFHSRLEDSEKSLTQQVLWTVVCAKEPITAETIATLAETSTSQVLTVLHSLRSVIHVPENSSLISTLHASFPEYMLDESRSKKFRCDSPQSNQTLAHRCFDVMKSELRFNICGLTSSYLADSEVEDLQTRVEQFISPTLSYACRYWAAHLLEAPAMSITYAMLMELLDRKLLFWMEVLSLCKCIGLGAPMMYQAQTWLQTIQEVPDAIRKQVADAGNFVTWFAANPCSRSTPHIYISALALCAKSNWVYQHYSKYIRGLAKVEISQRDSAALAVWNAESEVYSVTVSPDGSRIASGTGDGSIRIYDTHTGAVAAGPFRRHTEAVFSVAFSRDGTLLASGSSYNTVIVWDSHSGTIVSGPFDAHTRTVWSVEFSSDGSRVVSGSQDTSVIVWEVSTGSIVLGPLTGHTEDIHSVGYCLDDSLIMSGSADGTIRLWNSHTGDLVRQLPSIGGGIRQCAISPNGKQAVACYSEGDIQVWDVATGTAAVPAFRGHKDHAYSVGFSGDGKHVISGGGEDGKNVIVWDALTGSITIGPFRGHSREVGSVVSLADSTRVVSCSEDRTIRIWDVRTQDKTEQQPETSIASVGPLAFSANLSRFASVSPTQSLHVRELSTGDVISPELRGHTEYKSIECIALSPTGAYIAASTDSSTIHIWSALTGLVVSDSLPSRGGSIRCITFSPDDMYLCSGSDDTIIRVWEVNGGAMVGQPYQGHKAAVSVIVYSSDGTGIASGAADGTICIWDTVTGVALRTLSRHTSMIKCIAFSPSPSHIVFCGDDGNVCIWDSERVDTPSSDLWVPEYGSDSFSSCACFSPDGTWIAAGRGSTVRIFETRTMELISEMSVSWEEEIYWVGYSPDGIDIVSVSTSRTKGRGYWQGSSFQRHNTIRVWRPAPRLHETTAPSANYWSYESDGRILSPDCLVLWVPPDLIPYMEVWSKSHYNPFILSSEGIVDIRYKGHFSSSACIIPSHTRFDVPAFMCFPEYVA